MKHATKTTSDAPQRLAEIRQQWMCWSAVTDTSTWESTFFLRLLEEKDREIRSLRTLVKRCLKKLSRR